MKKRFTARRLLTIALCLTLALRFFGWVPRSYAAGATAVYTFGDASGPWRDLAAEYEKEAKQREKERKKAAQKQAMREKAAMKKAAQEAREREKMKNPAKNAEEGKADETC